MIPRKMGIHEFPEKGFKIIILKMFRVLQENTDKQFNEIRKTIQKQNEMLNRGRKQKRNKEILEMTIL